MDSTYAQFAAVAGAAAARRFVTADDAGQLEEGAAAATEVLLWWGIVDDQRRDARLAVDSDINQALRFARNCSAHRRISTRSAAGRSWLRTWPLRWDDRLFWRATDEVALGAHNLHKPWVMSQRAAYDELLCGQEVRHAIGRVLSDFAADN